MRFGIPEYRLPRTLIRAEIDKILALGVELRVADAAHPRVRSRRAEARWASTRCSSPSACQPGRDLQVPGVDLDGVVKAIDYLLNVNRGYRMDLGRRVVVIGGGFVAFDAARTALALGRDRADAGDRVADVEQQADAPSRRRSTRRARPSAAARARSRSSRSRTSTRCRCCARRRGTRSSRRRRRKASGSSRGAARNGWPATGGSRRSSSAPCSRCSTRPAASLPRTTTRTS